MMCCSLNFVLCSLQFIAGQFNSMVIIEFSRLSFFLRWFIQPKNRECHSTHLRLDQKGVNLLKQTSFFENLFTTDYELELSPVDPVPIKGTDS
jgi:hypothetical protein